MTVEEFVNDLAKYPGHGTVLIWDRITKDYRPCERWELGVVMRLEEVKG